GESATGLALSAGTGCGAVEGAGRRSHSEARTTSNAAIPRIMGQRRGFGAGGAGRRDFLDSLDLLPIPRAPALHEREIDHPDRLSGRRRQGLGALLRFLLRPAIQVAPDLAGEKRQMRSILVG